MSETPVLATIRGLACVVIALTLTVPGAGATETQNGKGPSFIIDINPGLIVRPPVTQPPPVVFCHPPAVYSKRFGRCVIPPPNVVVCRAPAVYSKRLGRCIVPEPQVVRCELPAVWSNKQNRCIIPPPPKRVSCEWPRVRSSSGCVCAAGYVSSQGRCIRPAPKGPVVVIDVAHIQECLTTLGYQPGPIDGREGRATRNAFRAYQQQNGLSGRPASLGDKPTQEHLFDACAAPPEAVAEAPPAAPPVAPARCLPRDLYDMLQAAYGTPPAIEPCRPDTMVCLPKPVFYSEAKLASIAENQGIRWCESCVVLNTWLPLATIFQIEAAASITLCASPPALCYLPARPAVQTKTEIRTIYRSLPISVGNEGDIAVVVGNEVYADGLTPNVYGHADADAVVQLLTEQLGYRKENIIDLRDAGLADLERVFGGADNSQGDLARRIADEQPGDVIVYVSSHGMSTEEGAGYLLPADADTDDLETTAYPLQRLYANLGKSGARTTMLMLEATFARSITDMVDPPNIPESEVVAMPEAPVAGLAVFTAADRDQHTLKDPEFGIGLFTRYLIAGLAGEADNAPTGNGDKRIDTVELFVYASDMVRTAARKSFGLEQKPLLSKIDNLVVGKLASAQ